jgi:tetratricopeptide (TPR) repeat protein
MLNFLAQSLNDLGNNAENRGMQNSASLLYRSATVVRPSWSSPWYNLGLQAKYQCRWDASVRFNQRAASLNPDDAASWWNLGIAATALSDWAQARKAWKGCGIEIDRDDDEVAMSPATACVRLNPDSSGEVVWGTRLDPARILVRNVPLPDSNRRYRDILLNDGASEGTRNHGDREYPVFNELAVWKPSNYNTFQSWLSMEDIDAEQHLVQEFDENEIGFEDWSTVRVTCAACSRGSLEQHHFHASEEGSGAKNYGFAATSRETLVQALKVWAGTVAGRNFSDPHLVLLAPDS